MNGPATIRRRVLITAGLIAFWALGIEGRLLYLQVIARTDLVERAERQHRRTQILPAVRGDLLDRRGRVLATSVDADTIVAVPAEIEDAAGVVQRVCAVFKDCTATERTALTARLSRSNFHAYVRRQVSPAVAEQVAGLKLAGIGFVKESRRYYPKSELAAHVLGFVGVDNKGLGGIEAAYDSQIRGQDGAVLVHVDAKSRTFSTRIERAPTSGSSLELTIDEYLQHVAERELQAAITETRAAGGSVVMLSPPTGEILAMANLPTFNPNLYGRTSPAARRNRAVQDQYEPGSAFKVVTAAAAIEEGVLSLDAPIDVSGGAIRVGSRIVRDDHVYGTLSFRDVIVKSSNVGAIKIAFLMGRDRFGQYVPRFGFGRQIAPDFPGENAGQVGAPASWSDGSLASVSFGHEIAVTPLQMAAAVNAIANDGQLMEPHVVRTINSQDRSAPTAPKVLRRVVSPATAAALTGVLEDVVERGTAKGARIPGFTVAGKTGTARKILDGRYSRSDYYASFVGFVPSRDPVATIIVMIDSPRSSIYGGAVAVPVFRRIAEATLRYLRVPPTLNPAPPVVPETIRATLPARVRPGTSEPAPDQQVVAAPGTMPDVTGLSARDAVRTLGSRGLRVRMSGDGFVQMQEPSPGLPVETGDSVRLVLGRQAAVLDGASAHP